MKKIILVGPLPPPYTGQSVSFKMLIDNLSHRGYKHALVNINLPSSKGDASSRWDWVKAGNYTLLLLKYLYLVIGKNKSVYITIAQSRVGFYRDFIMINVARLFNHRIVVHLKGGNYGEFYNQQNRITKKMINYTLERTDCIIVLGTALVKMYDFNPNLRNRIEVVHNGLPLQEIDLSQKNYDGQTKILYLSNLIYSKGYMHVLEAAKLLKQENYDFEIMFCGEFMPSADDLVPIDKKEMSIEFEEYVVKNNLEEHVKYLGSVTGRTKFEVLNHAHVFILPTNYLNEGQPVSIIEAMANGCALISTNYRTIPEMLKENVNGYFVEYGNPEDICAKLIPLINDAQLRRDMGKASELLFTQEFTQQAHLSKIIPLIVGD